MGMSCTARSPPHLVIQVMGESQEVTLFGHLEVLPTPVEMPAAQDLIPQSGRGGIGERYPQPPWPCRTEVGIWV